MVYRSIPRIYHLRSRSEEVYSFDEPPSEARGLSKLQTSDDLDRGWYICGIDRITMVHMLYAIVMMSYVLAQVRTRDVVLYWVHLTCAREPNLNFALSTEE